ncbi:SMI1/KNR4 family protein [Actinomadura parmotrematis]|uniref:SMI1/KNR4 family protein n=1 Tax=Actinomadura parmotrematis TaxID=2864039 RepID=A0ABS7FPH2_9ACTN|nr:SMI1/KNR4 family protein [Actinomadura parmotrematis]MBW8482282.1 SMI1/KNR4 family protein [Actinomadura parmotrematis]
MGIEGFSVRAVADRLKARYGDAEVVGIGEHEVLEVMRDQDLDRIPGSYHDFLLLMGRGAGGLLRGTDAFYPQIIGLKEDSLEIARGGSGVSIPANALVFAMHQGYQVYWMVDLVKENPRVYMYQEGDTSITREWPSFVDLLMDELRLLWQ